MENENKSTVEMKLTCNRCGGSDLEIPDDATDDSMVVCKPCGVEVARWGDVKTAAFSAVENQVVSAFRNMLKNIPGITFKE